MIELSRNKKNFCHFCNDISHNVTRIRVKACPEDYLVCRSCLFDMLKDQFKMYIGVERCNFCRMIIKDRKFLFLEHWYLCKNCNLQVMEKIMDFLEGS